MRCVQDDYPMPSHSSFSAPTRFADPDTMNQVVRDVLERHRDTQAAMLPVLHDIHDALGYVPPSCVPLLSKALNRSRAEIHGVLSFYAHFRQTPPAPVKLEICRAEACQAMGSERLAQHAVQSLGCHFSGTSKDQRVDLEPVYCLGLCAQSPAVAVNGHPHARMTPEKLDQLLKAATTPETQEPA